MPYNESGLPVGDALPGWQVVARPSRAAMQGEHCRLESLSAALHGDDLYRALSQDASGGGWTYLPYGPFDPVGFRAWLARQEGQDDPVFFAIVVDGAAIGLAAYMRIEPGVGCIEVGHLHFSPRLQRTLAATEAMYLMMRRAFESGYRRYEWKCDSLNAPSRRAAQRLGFSFEGIFRQARVVKGRNRDTAWFAIIDGEWPALQQAFLAWLAPENFDAKGGQKTALSALTGPLLYARDPGP